MKIIEEKELPQGQDGGSADKKRAKLYAKEMHRMAYPNWLDLLAIVGIFLGASFVVGLVVLLVGFFTKTDAGGGVSALSAATEGGAFNMLTYALTFAITIFFVIVLQRNRGVKKSLIRFNFKKFNPAMVLWGIVLVVVAGVVIEPVVAIFPTKYLDFLNSAIGTGGWAILTTVILAPILEEVLFRGLILESVRQKSGAVRAVLISALIFGLIHIIPQQVVNAFVVGIILGYVYVKTGSLINVILIHAVNNGVAYLMMELLGDSANDATVRSMIGNDTLYWVVYGLFLILFGIAIHGIVKSLRKSHPVEDTVTVEKTIADDAQ